MRLVDYCDELGRWYKVALPDDAPDAEAAFGNPIGPPTLDELNLPPSIVTELHNWLFKMNIFTARDAQMHRQDISSAIQRLCAIHTERVVELYGEAERPQVVASITMPAKSTGDPRVNMATPRQRRR